MNLNLFRPSSLRVACLFFSAFVLLSTDAAAQPSGCGKASSPFAHCDANARNFQTVLVAVHGWNGDCASTFGSLNQSIFEIMTDRFYDMDCFEYDSKKIRLDDNVELLRKRLVDLHAMGYRQAVILTHSTGGIITLRLLSKIALDNNSLALPEKTAPIQTGSEKDLTIMAVHAYATPINGLRAWITWVGEIARLTTSPETLPDLKPGSPYLAKLHGDLKTLASLLNAATAPDRARVLIPIQLYQGQEEDRIVLSIDEAAARAAGWWPYGAILVNTASGHSHNVAESGVVGLPNYPARLLQLSTLLELNLLPRLDEVFPNGISTVPPALKRRQLITVDGISGYVDHQLQKAEGTMVAFLKRVVTDAYTRDPDVDQRVMDRFATSITRATLRLMTPELVGFCDRIIHQVFKGYDTGKDVSLTRFGEGRSRVAKQIVEVMELVRRKVVEYLQRNPSIASSALPYSGSLEAFKAATLSVQAKVLASRYDDAQSVALKTIAGSIDQFSSTEITKAGFNGAINNYALVRFSTQDAQDRDTISKIYGAMLVKEPTLSDPTFVFLNQPVRWLNAQKPLWTAVLNDKTIEDVIFNKREPSALPSTAKLDFLTGVIRETGATGNALPTARLAVGEASQMILEVPSSDLKQEWREKFLKAGKASSYPAIRYKVDQAGRLSLPQ